MAEETRHFYRNEDNEGLFLYSERVVRNEERGRLDSKGSSGRLSETTESRAAVPWRRGASGKLVFYSRTISFILNLRAGGFAETFRHTKDLYKSEEVKR